MTLTRPAYRAIVTNLDNPWTKTVTAGDTYNPADGVWLADGLQLGWRFNGPPPTQLEPEVAQFSLLAEGMDQLPTFELGDRVSISLQRPTLADPITYMDFAGRITDAKLTSDASQGLILLELTAVDPTSELTHEFSQVGSAPQDAPTQWAGTVVPYGGVWYEFIAGNYRWYDSPQVTIKGSFQAADLTAKVLPGTLTAPSGEGSYAVQRYVLDEITDPDWTFFPFGGETAWAYFLARWLPEPDGTLEPLFQYAWDGTDADQVTTVAVAGPIDPAGALIALDACHMPDLADWTKDRTASPNRVIVSGVDGLADAVPPVTATDSASVARFGAITRTIDTQVMDVGLSELAARYLELMPTNSALSWLFEQTTILTDVMDDATLDAYAPLFWTPREPVPGVMGKPVVLFGVADEVDPTDGFMFAHLAGVTFTAQDGKLEIVPELLPCPTPELPPVSPSYDAFGASAFGTATYHDQGGTTEYIDPDLSYDRAKLATL